MSDKVIFKTVDDLYNYIEEYKGTKPIGMIVELVRFLILTRILRFYYITSK